MANRPRPKALDHQIAFNVIPRIDRFVDDAYTVEEQKVRQETCKIMHAPEIRLSATCVRVPVYVSPQRGSPYGVSTAPCLRKKPRELLKDMPGVKVLDDPEQGAYPMPWDVTGTDDVFRGADPARLFPPQRPGDVDSGRQSAERSGPQLNPNRRRAGVPEMSQTLVSRAVRQASLTFRQFAE